MHVKTFAFFTNNIESWFKGYNSFLLEAFETFDDHLNPQTRSLFYYSFDTIKYSLETYLFDVHFPVNNKLVSQRFQSVGF